MFFYIGESSPIKALTHVHTSLYIDDAWFHSEVFGVPVWYKGYSTDCVLADALQDILNGYQPAGKWCVISYDNTYKIHHYIIRPFPIFQRGEEYTNINLDGFIRTPYELPQEPIYTSPISIDDAAERIGDVLHKNTINFYKYNQIGRMNVLFSGGLDTLTSWAILDSIRHDYDLNVYLPKLGDTGVKHTGRIREVESDLIDNLTNNYWGYTITSTYKNPSWYITGFYGERFTLREVTQSLSIAKYLKILQEDMLKETDYMYWFMKRPSNHPSQVGVSDFDNEAELRKYFFNTCYHDHQMWHLNNNFHFSPFFDIRIAKISHNLSLHDIMKNSANGITQRKVIERFRPEFIQLLSDYKNAKDIFKNFKKNFLSIKLNPEVKVKLR